MKKNSFIPRICLALLGTALSLITIFQPYNNTPAIRSDGSGYHAWVHAIKNRTLSFCEHQNILGPVGAISMIDSTGQKCGNKYPPGVGIIQAPFTLFFAQQNTNKGFTEAEHWSVLTMGPMLLLGTVFISGKTLQNLDCRNTAILLSNGAVIFGTGLLHYATYDASFSHIYSSFLFACILYIATKKTQHLRAKAVDWEAIAYALLCMLLILTRQTNLALILGASSILAVNKNLELHRKKQFALLSLLALSFGLSFYFIYNYYHLGYLTLSTYGEERILPFATNTLKVFVSYERGLFTYYPIFLLAVLIGWIHPKFKSIYVASIGLIISYGLIYGSWHSWPLGAGFGHRGFVDMAPIIILTLGLTFEEIGKSDLQKFWIPFISILAITCVYITTTTQHGYWIGKYPFSGADHNLYWSTLLQSPGQAQEKSSP